MPVILNEKNKRRCDVMASGPIAELGNILGPVYGSLLTTPTIIKLVSNGRKVYEIDPRNSKNKVLLTIGNCSKSVFGTNLVEEPVKKEEPPVVEIPKEVVVEKTEEVTSNDHEEILKVLGLSKVEWAMKSKSERRRLKEQYLNKKQDNKVTEPIVAEAEETPIVEEKAVEELKTETVSEVKKDEAEVPVEEEVVAADV